MLRKGRCKSGRKEMRMKDCPVSYNRAGKREQISREPYEIRLFRALCAQESARITGRNLAILMRTSGHKKNNISRVRMYPDRPQSDNTGPN
jgi:hypothetical protein